ncbi:MAG: T9SS type A sorting domain-containing protein [Prevotella sp.]|nr:T9SS type A sorting domain-containing protein [Prevotella sp.]
MKKVFLISLCVLALSASAQNTALKVQSNGKIAIQTNSTALSPIAINCAGNSSNYIYCNASGKSGMYLTTSGNNSGNIYGGQFHSSNASRAVGLLGETCLGDTCIGIMGSAYAPNNKAIGVSGHINFTNYGAAIYGGVEDGYEGFAWPIDGKYAGFFRGNVKVTGTLDATLLGESSSSSGSSGSGLSLRGASVANSLSSLNVTTYQKERPERPQTTEMVYKGLDGDTLYRGKAPEPDIIDEQFYDKTHYALDADRLEEVFPNLVYVRKDGSKAINYVEMIPLLVQSINELSAKIEVLEGQASEETARKTRSAKDLQASSLTQNRLYQNMPNPFKEQTVIRFSLADDAQNAAICIFDMTGKTIKKLPISSGMESVSIGGYELGEGMFLYSLVVNGQEIDTKKMIITK